MEQLDEESRDRDKLMKEKGKMYNDARRQAKQNDVKQGDMVLIKRQIKSNKLETNYEPRVYKVVQRKGSELVVKNMDAKTQYKRNVAHIKLVHNEQADDYDGILQQQQTQQQTPDNNQILRNRNIGLLDPTYRRKQSSVGSTRGHQSSMQILF